MTPSIHATSIGPAPPDDLVLHTIEARLFPSRLRHGLTSHGLVLGGERALPVVRIRAGSLAGHGEAPPLPSFTGEGAGATLTGVKRVARSLVGLPLSAALDRLHAPGFASPPVRAALDMALHDLWAQALATPLHGLLGRQGRSEVRISRAIGYHDLARTIEIARGYVGSGVGALKLKVGRDPDEDARILLAVRAEVGSRVELAADANGAFDEAAARRFVAGAARADLAYLEQPLPRGDLAGAGRLRQLGIPVVLDEGAFDAGDVERIARERAADAVAIKLIKCGGLRPALHMIRAARDSGLGVLVVDPLGSAISLDAGLHLAAVLPDPGFAHGLSGGLEVTAPHAPHRPVVHGRLRVPDDPGLGARVVWPSPQPVEKQPHRSRADHSASPSPRAATDPEDRSRPLARAKESTMKLAFATIGEAPRDDLVPYLRSALPPSTTVIEDGVLNHLDEAGRLALDAGDDSLHMVTRDCDARAYRLSYRRTLPQMQRVVDGLVAQGADLVVILCGADWDPVIAPVPIVNLGKLFPNLVQALAGNSRLGVIKPDSGQIPHSEKQFAALGIDAVVTAASPYVPERHDLAREAARILAQQGAELIWMSCVGMPESMRAVVHDVLPRPIILARSILARVVGELLAVSDSVVEQGPEEAIA